NNANNNSDTGPDTGANTGGLDVRKALPGNFSSTEDSMLEARNLLDRGGVTAEEYYAQIEQLRQTPLWSDDSSDSLIAIPSDDFNADTTGSAVSQPGQTQIGFADPDTPSARTDQITADPPVSVISDISGTPGVSGMSGVSPQSYRIPPPPVLYPIQPSPQRHRINVGRPTRPSPNKPIVLKRSRRVTVRLPKRPMLVSVIRRQVLGR
ncbi:MAG: hypothetical protein FWE86_03460, partial [Oscillospiraceae bacterium]|nr:hypothetical protein [Oscillospiraceae bacterium]